MENSDFSKKSKLRKRLYFVKRFKSEAHFFLMIDNFKEIIRIVSYAEKSGKKEYAQILAENFSSLTTSDEDITQKVIEEEIAYLIYYMEMYNTNI